MEEKLLEYLPKKIEQVNKSREEIKTRINETRQSLEKDKAEAEEQLSKISSKDFAEMKEVNEDLSKINAELSSLDEREEKENSEVDKEISSINGDKSRLNIYMKQKEAVQKENKKIEKAEESLLKNKAEAEAQLSKISSKDFVEMKEVNEDLKRINEELLSISEKKIDNENMIGRCDKAIDKIVSKYSLELEQEDKRIQEEKIKEEQERARQEAENKRQEEEKIKQEQEKKRQEEYEKIHPESTNEYYRRQADTAKDRNEKRAENRDKVLKRREELGMEDIREELPPNSPVPKVIYDITTGKYTLIKQDKSRIEYDSLSEENKISMEERDRLRNELIYNNDEQKQLLPKYARMVDLDLYKFLKKEAPELLEGYLLALKDKDKEPGFDLTYNLKRRGRKIEKNIGLLSRIKIGRMAKKHKMATVLKDKSRAGLVAILGALGLSTAGVSGAYLLNEGKQKEIAAEENQNENDGQLLKRIKENLTELATEAKENVEQQTTEIKEILESLNEKAIVGQNVTIRGGAKLYSNPQDAVKIQLGEETEEKVVEKSDKYADRVYLVTKEGLYCPDGTCIAPKEGESLREAVEKAGLLDIFDNIDSEEIEALGYKHMIHVEAEGIAEWAESGDTLVHEKELKKDKLGNVVEKSEEEEALDEKLNEKQEEKTEEAELKKLLDQVGGIIPLDDEER